MRKILSFILTLCMVIAVFAAVPAQAETEKSGKCGDNLTCTFSDDGMLTISGSGDMWDFTDGDNTPWRYYRSKIESVQISDGVTSIGNNAFCAVFFKNPGYGGTYFGYNFTSIDIPDSVKKIGNRAFFYSCLKSIDIPDGVTGIGDSAFWNCNLLESVSIPGSVTGMSFYAFANCVNLKSVHITDLAAWCNIDFFIESSNPLYFAKNLYIDGKLATDIVIPDGVKTIEQYAFCNCKSITSVAIPDSVTLISEAFHGCTNLKTVYYAGTKEQWNKINIFPPTQFLNANIRFKKTCVHNYEKTNLTEPTCSETGKQYYICTLCNDEYYETVPTIGHNYSLNWTTDLQPTCTEKGSTSRHCTNCDAKTDPITIEPTGHSFGKWITDVVPTVVSDGSKYRSCTVCGFRETEAISKTEYDVESNPGYGAVNFRVVDATTLAPLKGITVACEGVTVVTDVSGKAYAVLPVGKQKFNVYGGGYLSRSLEYNIVSGVNNLPDIGISTKPLVDVTINHHEMTLDEIKVAGIDITSPENQHVYNYEMKMVYTPDVDYYKVNFYWNETGKLVDIKPVKIPDHVYIPGGYTPPTIHYPEKPDVPPYIEIPPAPERPYPTFVYPVSEECYLVVYGKVKWLKEMYDVEMVVINNSNTDTIEKCTAALSLPDGISLAVMEEGKEQSLEQKIEHIAAGETAILSWCIKGDKKGSYNITASLEGTFMPFNESFRYTYTTQSPIIVEAGSAMHMTFEVPGVVYYGKNCPVRITLENVSDMPVYFMNHTINSVDQYKIISYSNDNSVKEDYGTAGGSSIYREIFNPGEKMVIELNTNIKFDSEFIRERFFDTNATIDGLDAMLQAFEVYENAAENISDLKSVFEKAMLNIPADSSAGILAKEAFSSLISECSQINSNSVCIYSDVVSSEYYYIIKHWVDNIESVTISESDLTLCAKFINKTIANSKTKALADYNTFDKITSVIISTPVKFLLSDVIVTTLEGSTTEIPYTIKVIENPDAPLYFGTENIKLLAYSTIAEQLGEVDIPLILKLTDTADNPEGYKEVIGYLNAVKEDVQRFAAKSSTGKTSFKAWIEDADGNVIIPYTEQKTPDDESPFTLLCSNSTAKTKDGIISFEGAGYIDVIPHTSKGATLFVEMMENGITKTDKYQIDVVEEHECSSSKWEILLPPYNEAGYRAQLCSECDSIIKVESFNANVFSDVPADSWYQSAVQYAVTNGIMNGTSETEFSPENGLTRAMFVTVLHRLAGSPAGDEHIFNDVSEDSWYNSAVEWASSNGIINGVAQGVFAPDEQITREQMATIVYRYAKYKNYDMKGAQSVAYTDVANIALYANEAVLWCSENGIMKGNAEGTFTPGDYSTRAQAATVFMRLLTVFDK